MDLSTDLPVFSIPFRHQWNRNSVGEIDIVGPSIDGMVRFIGDRRNLIIKGLFTGGSAANVSLDRSRLTLCPFVLFGSSGTGKTSLALELVSELSQLWLAGFHVKSSRKSTFHKSSLATEVTNVSDVRNVIRSPLILSAADFDRRFRSAMEIDAVADFRNKIMLSSGLLIDDLQLLAGKPSVQSELSGIIDRMITNNIPLIFTSDVNPLDLVGFSSQLISRLCQGTLLPLLPPGSEAREIIIRDLCQIHQLELTEEAICFLIQRFGSSTVPRISHFFSQLLLAHRCHQELHSRSSVDQQLMIDLSFVSRLFELPIDDMKLVATGIIDIVANKFNVKRKDIIGQTRKQSVVMARSIAIYLIRDFLGTSFSLIGQFFGYRDHTTILHSYRKIKSIVDRCELVSLGNSNLPTPDPSNATHNTNSEYRLISDLTLQVADLLTAEIHYTALP